MRSLRVILCVLLVSACVLQATVASSQMLVMDVQVYVTELRPDKNKIGTAPRLHVSTRQWIRVEGRTLVFRRNGKPVSQAVMWRSLKRGQRIRVQGGQDWDTNIVAKKIYF